MPGFCQPPLRSSESCDEVTPQPATILVVEDEPAILSLELTLLEPLGFQLLSAVNGMEAIERSTEFKGNIELLISDVMMPDMNGQRLALRLREDRPQIKVLLVSGNFKDLSRNNPLVTSPYDFLQKPFTPSGFVEKVRGLLSRLDREVP